MEIDHVITTLPFSARTGMLLTAALLTSTLATAGEPSRIPLVLASTNDATGNSVAVFELRTSGTPALNLAQLVPTGGNGGAAGDAGILQFKDGEGAVANFGSNTVTRLKRSYNRISVDGTIQLAPGCTHPDSVALSYDHLFVVGATCAESFTWPEGYHESGSAPIKLPDATAAQIAVGKTWAAVTLGSGSVLNMPLAHDGGLSGQSSQITLPSDANNTPLGAAFWDDTLGFEPAHSVDSFALATANGQVFPVAGPAPAYPTNAPCWLAKGRGNIWYAGNSPGHAISIFFSDGQGGVFYKSVPVPGVVTDLSTSRDGRWLAALYTADGSGFVTVFSVDDQGDLTLVATSSPIGAASFSGVAFSQ
jgi:hypothetical protein